MVRMGRLPVTPSGVFSTLLFRFPRKKNFLPPNKRISFKLDLHSSCPPFPRRRHPLSWSTPRAQNPPPLSSLTSIPTTCLSRIQKGEKLLQGYTGKCFACSCHGNSRIMLKFLKEFRREKVKNEFQVLILDV
ncbi:hypothetical protein CEXT_95081 [Caerostris extrusa]|uniref:Uncharacterized protein n=1 Tax=Caerostris extrusa TaxID=172846 RepID=A0AAV4PBL7_CAEEX|nr:hypothetical protein CEXT_95081 [Caerostris extrusa]